MEPWQLVFITLYSGPLAWVIFNSIRQGNQVTTINHKLDHLVTGQDKLFALFTVFTKTEIEELKNISKQVLQSRS